MTRTYRYKLNHDIILYIYHELSSLGARGTLAAIAQCSAATNEIATPVLYRRIEITRSLAALLFRGVRRLSLYDRIERLVLMDTFALGDISPLLRTQHGCPDLEEEENYDPAVWTRRRQLLGHCRHLSLLEGIPVLLVLDLLDALGMSFVGKLWTDGCQGKHDVNHTDERQVDAGCERSASPSNTLFPRLAHLAILEDCVIDIFVSSDQTQTCRPTSLHLPIFHLLRSFRAKHVCLTLPTAATCIAAFVRQLGTPHLAAAEASKHAGMLARKCECAHSAASVIDNFLQCIPPLCTSHAESFILHNTYHFEFPNPSHALLLRN